LESLENFLGLFSFSDYFAPIEGLPHKTFLIQILLIPEDGQLHR